MNKITEWLSKIKTKHIGSTARKVEGGPKGKSEGKPKDKPQGYRVHFLMYPLHIIKLLLSTIFGLLGACGWFIQTVIGLLSVAIVVCTSVGLLTYTELKPEIDGAMRTAYDKLQDMRRSDFSMLEDTEVYDTNGDLIGIINAGHYEYADIADISLNIQNAYIAQEDRRFKEHNGVDFISTFRAGLALLKHNGEITQGGSTITQQVIKNTYLTQEKSFRRKIVEILLAPQVEREFSKADIMEFYCNTNFYGNRCYGVQAASRYYFGKDASDLEIWEAATLAGISNSPSAYNPVKHPEESREKRDEVLRSMYEVGFIDRAEFAEAKEQPLNIVQETQEGTNENYQMSYAVHCATLELMKQDGFDFKYTFKDKNDYTTYMERYDKVYGELSDKIRAGGYKIYTTLDSEIQAKAQESLDSVLSKFTQKQENGKFAIQGAAAVLDNTSNYIVAVIGGRGTDDRFNRAYLSARQPGSSIKPLLDYGPAFDTGEFYPSKVMNDHKFNGGPDNSGGGFRGNITIREALNRSLNTIAWQLLQNVGVNKGLEYLDKMHFHKISYIDNGVEALSLGGFTNGVRVVDMARGYATLANGGVYSDKTCIKAIHYKDTELTKGSKEWTEQVYDVDTAYMLTDVLKGTITEPWGTGHGLGLANGMPAAGKTGTTNNNKDAWFCGYTKYYSVAVWMGYDTPKSMPGVYGATYAGRIWQSIMNQLHDGKEVLDWDKPDTTEMVPYNPATGERADYDTGIYDLFSVSAELRAKQVQYEKQQKALADKLEEDVVVYENFHITQIEQVYQLETQKQAVLDKLSQIQEDSLRVPLVERVDDKYDELNAIATSMADAIEEYEKSKEEQKRQQEEQIRLEAEQKREKEELELRTKAFTDALQKIKDLKYKQSMEELAPLLNDAREKLKVLSDTPYHEQFKLDLETAIINIDNLPDKASYDALEAEKKRQEEEAERLKQEADARKAQEADEEIDRLIQQYGPGWQNSSSGSIGYNRVQMDGPKGNNSVDSPINNPNAQGPGFRD